MKAKLVKTLSKTRKLYKCEPGGKLPEYVVVSAVTVGNSPMVALAEVVAGDMYGPGAETFIFEADATGEIVSWLDLPGSFKGGLDHAKALRNAGYEVE